RAHGGNDRDDDLAFATAKRTSDAMAGMYRTFVSHWIKAFATERGAEFLRRCHPLRLQYELVSNLNPLTISLAATANAVRKHRKPAAPDNAFFRTQERFSSAVEKWLEEATDARDAAYEAMFFAIYGNSLLQALVGLRSFETPVRRKPGDDAGHHAFVAKNLERLESEIESGGLAEAVLRSLIYIRLEHAVGDQRAYTLLQMMKSGWLGQEPVSLAEFKQTIREQFLMLVIDEDRAVAAIPQMLPRSAKARDQALAFIHDVMGAQGELDRQSTTRLKKIERLFAPPAPKRRSRKTA
ncbi:MAG: DUF3141 domain-containing protein, partial [Pseudomonadota bacterium]